MKSYSDIVVDLNLDQKSDLEKLVKDNFVSENQIKQIFINSLGLEENSSSVELKVMGYKLIQVLFVLQSILESKFDLKEKENSIKRLMDKNLGIETINEMLSHMILHHTFSKYSVRSLFGQGSDGQIIDGEVHIPVEIKSRFPQKIILLRNFFSEIFDIIPKDDDLMIFLDITITKLIKINNDIIAEEIENIYNYFFELFDEKISITDLISKDFQSSFICYTIDLRITRTAPTNMFGLTNESINRTLFQSIIGKNIGSQIMPLLAFNATINEDVNKAITDEIFEGFFPNRNNYPDEPRILAFYSDYWHDEILANYMHELFDSYSKKHSGTMLLGLISFFHERREDNKMGVKYLSAGNEIKPLIKKYFKAKLDLP